MESSTFGPVLDWNDIIKKEARGLENADLGKVHEVNETFVITEKGVINKEKFHIPKSIPHGYNGRILLFEITEEEARKKFMKDVTSSPPLYFSSTEGSADSAKEENGETIMPLTEERLDVSKKETMEEATVIKESVKETKTVEVQLTHEELIIEKRKPSSSSSGDTTTEEEQQKQIQSKTEITIPLKKEEVVVTKKPYVKEEIVIKKKQVTETKTVSEDLISEKVSNSDRGISREEIKETDGA
jgi:uncharacterized protein (TIGR02271 family)